MSGALEFHLPDVGEGIAEAEIVTWHVAEGDRVREDQELVDIETDKAVVTIPCPTTGVVRRLCVAPGELLQVGELLAVFAPERGDGEAEIAPEARTERAGAPYLMAAPAPPVERPPGAASGDRPLAAPATRRRARELGIDLHRVRGSGPHGRILRDDVERAAGAAAGPGGPERVAPEGPPPVARSVALDGPSRRAGGGAGETIVPLRGVRRAIARALSDAWREVPRVIDYREVDASGLLRARALLRERALARGDEELARALTPTPLIVRAAVRALHDHPYVNASVDLEREQITLHHDRHVGIATATPDGLMVPVLHDADRLGLSDMARRIAALSAAARERRLTPAALAGATFTVNNYGGLGVWLGTPIVRPPEVANLGVGAIRDQVVAVNGAPVVRPTLALAVAGDHRVLDGHTLAAFVTQVVELLEEPLLLLDGA